MEVVVCPQFNTYRDTVLRDISVRHYFQEPGITFMTSATE